jgi:hypothetical protein
MYFRDGSSSRDVGEEEVEDKHVRAVFQRNIKYEGRINMIHC